MRAHSSLLGLEWDRDALIGRPIFSNFTKKHEKQKKVRFVPLLCAKKHRF
jgi:hypothetical protein